MADRHEPYTQRKFTVTTHHASRPAQSGHTSRNTAQPLPADMNVRVGLKAMEHKGAMESEELDSRTGRSQKSPDDGEVHDLLVGQ